MDSFKMDRIERMEAICQRNRRYTYESLWGSADREEYQRLMDEQDQFERDYA